MDTLAKAPVTGQMNLFIDQTPLDRGNSESVSLDKSAPKFVDLFAGCGGLSLGLENAGFLPVFVNELSPDALGTYVRNRQKVNPLLGSKYQVRDVKQLVLDETLLDDLISGFKADYDLNTSKGDLDLLVGGPPCQGYSGIGHRRSYSVEREQLPSNHLYEDMAFIIARLRPKIFLFENVKGLLSARWTKQGEKGEIWDDVRSKFENIPGYQTKWSLVRAKDYATPQNRPRVLLVGIRDDLGINLDSSIDAVANGLLPQPGGDSPHLEDLLGDLLDPAFENGGSTTTYPYAPQNPIQELLRLDPHLGTPLGVGSPVSEHEYSNHRPQVIKKFQYMLDHDGYISDELKASRRSLGKSKTRVNLFAQVPDWTISKYKSSAQILDSFGYRREDGVLRLNCTVSATAPNSQKLQLKVNYDDDVIDEIENNNGQHSDVARWRLEKLRSRILEKHLETFWVKAVPSMQSGVEHFHYIEATHTQQPKPELFGALIADGTISLDHLIKRENGRTSERGPLFKIWPDDLTSVLTKQVTYDLSK